MISVSYLFETPNVPNEQANGLTVPFGNFAAYQERNKKLLSDAQNMGTMDAEDQKNFMVKNGLMDSGV